jgi:hypothetical protein
MHRRDLPASLDLLRGFEAAARLLSFTSAAAELHLTQSAVSRQVQQLEEQLGVKLFERRTRALILTEAGERYYREVSKVATRPRPIANAKECVIPRCPAMSLYAMPKRNAMTSRSGTIDPTIPTVKSRGSITFCPKAAAIASGTAGWVSTVGIRAL